MIAATEDILLSRIMDFSGSHYIKIRFSKMLFLKHLHRYVNMQRGQGASNTRLDVKSSIIGLGN